MSTTNQTSTKMTFSYAQFNTKLLFLSVLFLLFNFTSFPTNARSVYLNGATSSAHREVEVNDCPDLEANFGDPCDDGNAATENDIITPDCICAGTYSTPANDLIENATQLPLNDWNACNDNPIMGTTLGANNELGTFECDSANDSLPDVFYTFNSGDFIYVDIDLALTTQADFIISVSEADEAGEVLFCDSAMNPFLLEKQTDYIIRIAPLSGLESAGEFSICLSATHMCPDGSDFGDPCFTYMGAPGFLNSECECEPVITDCSNLFFGDTLALSNSNNVISYGTYTPNKWFHFTNAMAGAEYTITANLGPTDGFLTVRTGDNIISGYSPLTFTSTQTGNFSLDLNLDEYCSVSNALLYSITSQCNSCEYNCPELEGNYGESCSDANPNTINDTIAADCTCIGEYDAASLAVSTIWDSNCMQRDLNVKFFAPGDTIMLYSFTTSINSNGSFSLSDTIAAGNYDIYAKLDGFLAKGFYDQSLSPGGNTLSLGTFEPGDLNNDNAVNLIDVTVLNTTFGMSEGDSNFNYLADSNCDGQVNIVDVSPQFVAFGQTGMQP